MKWISVTDNLPRINDVVLVYDKHIEDVTTGFISEFIGDRSVWIIDYGGSISDEVTHWMPFPEPPNEK